MPIRDSGLTARLAGASIAFSRIKLEAIFDYAIFYLDI